MAEKAEKVWFKARLEWLDTLLLLSDAEAGKLMKALWLYQGRGTAPALRGKSALVFSLFSSRLRQDEEERASYIERQREYGRMGSQTLRERRGEAAAKENGGDAEGTPGCPGEARPYKEIRETEKKDRKETKEKKRKEKKESSPPVRERETKEKRETEETKGPSLPKQAEAPFPFPVNGVEGPERRAEEAAVRISRGKEERTAEEFAPSGAGREAPVLSGGTAKYESPVAEARERTRPAPTEGEAAEETSPAVPSRAGREAAVRTDGAAKRVAPEAEARERTRPAPTEGEAAEEPAPSEASPEDPPAADRTLREGQREPAPDGMLPPTAEEVEEFARQRGLKVNGALFVEYYSAKGWMMGGSPMRSWRSAVCVWAARERPAPAERLLNAQKYGQRPYGPEEEERLQRQLIREVLEEE